MIFIWIRLLIKMDKQWVSSSHQFSPHPVSMGGVSFPYFPLQKELKAPCMHHKLLKHYLGVQQHCGQTNVTADLALLQQSNPGTSLFFHGMSLISSIFDFSLISLARPADADSISTLSIVTAWLDSPRRWDKTVPVRAGVHTATYTDHIWSCSKLPFTYHQNQTLSQIAQALNDGPAFKSKGHTPRQIKTNNYKFLCNYMSKCQALWFCKVHFEPHNARFLSILHGFPEHARSILFITLTAEYLQF